MEKLAVLLSIISTGSFVWSNLTSVEILRNPSKVFIHKPYPFLAVEKKVFDDVKPSSKNFNNSTSEKNTDLCLTKYYEEDVFSQTSLTTNITNYFNSTLWEESRLPSYIHDIQLPSNLTLHNETIIDCIGLKIQTRLFTGTIASLAGG